MLNVNINGNNTTFLEVFLVNWKFFSPINYKCLLFFTALRVG